MEECIKTEGKKGEIQSEEGKKRDKPKKKKNVIREKQCNRRF